jgi:PAS domain S-box-containing protein
LDQKSRYLELEDNLRFESMMARLSARFVNLPASEVDSVIKEGQRLICEGLGLDRSAVFQRTVRDPDELLLTHICQPAKPDIPKKPADAQLLSDREWIELDREIPRSYRRLDAEAHFPWITERVKRCETVSISRLGDLPEEAARDRETLRGFGTKSTVVVPLQMEGEWAGFLTFASLRSERDWSEQLLERFRFVADLFTSVLFRQRAEETLQRSEERYRRLFDAGSDAIFLVDAASGRILDANPAAEEMYGYSREEFLQFSISDISAEPEATRHALATAVKHVSVRWHRRRNGASFPVEISVSDFVDHGCKTYIGAIRDITERKRIEQEIQVSEARYRSLIETQADVIARSDFQGRLTYVNDAYCRMFGMSRQELVGRVFFPTVLPEDLHVSQSALKSIKEPPYRITTETRHPTPNGIRWISWENTAVVDDSGNILELQGTGRDITERKQAQDALRKSEERYREFIKLSAEGICRFEADEPIDTSRPEAEQIESIGQCRLAECSQAFARMYGLDEPEQFVGARLQEILNRANPGDIELVRSFVRSGYRVLDSETSETDRQGNPRHFSRSLDGVVECGRLVRAWLLQHETTRRKLAEEGLRHTERALRESQEDLRRLAGRLIFAQEEERRRLGRELHDDLSQRLAMLTVDAETLQQDLSGSAESLREQVQDLQTRLSEISRDIHGISRRLHPSIIETLGLAKAIESECRNFAQREQVEIRCDAQTIPAAARSEVALCLFRIVQEGLRNIAKHARAAKAEVRLNVEEDAIHLRIEDDGIGFNPNPARKRSGLGLASMDERIRLLRGSVVIDSAPGKGTVIEVRVPLESEESGAAVSMQGSTDQYR